MASRQGRSRQFHKCSRQTACPPAPFQGELNKTMVERTPIQSPPELPSVPTFGVSGQLVNLRSPAFPLHFITVAYCVHYSLPFPMSHLIQLKQHPDPTHVFTYHSKETWHGYRWMAWSPRRPAMLLPSWRLPSAQPYSTPYMILRVSLVKRLSATSACVLSSRMSVFQLE